MRQNKIQLAVVVQIAGHYRGRIESRGVGEIDRAIKGPTAGAGEERKTDLRGIDRDRQIHFAVPAQVGRGDILGLAGHREIRFRQKGSIAISQHHRGEVEPGACEINFPVPIQVRGDMRVSEERIIPGRKGGGLRQRACRRGECHQGPKKRARKSGAEDSQVGRHRRRKVFHRAKNAAVQSLAAIKEKLHRCYFLNAKRCRATGADTREAWS